MVIYATRQHLALSATNSSLSAYCRFNYSRQFFSRYTIQEDPNWDAKDDTIRVSGQLLVKSLLSILKPTTANKSVERCELTFAEGGAAQPLDEEERDSLESKLIVRLHCKHGVVKTHRLLLHNATNLMVPGVTNPTQESKLSIGARSLKDLLDPFPIAKGPKSDPQIILTLNEDEVILKAQESSLDTSVRGQLSTELSISPAEFEVYDVYEPPLTVGLHLKEFMATIAFAESQALTLDMRLTEPAAPLFIDIDGDLSETLFVISTSQVREHDVPAGVPPARRAPSHASNHTPHHTQSHAESRAGSRIDSRAGSLQPRGRKRELESVEPDARAFVTPGPGPGSARRKPQPAVVRGDRESVARALASQDSARSASVVRAMPPPPPPAARAPPQHTPPPNSNPFAPAEDSTWPRARAPQEPLFLPGSQIPLSQAAAAAIRESGLGIEDMDEAEFAAMLEDDGEEFVRAPAPSRHAQAGASAAGAPDADADEGEDEERDELDEDEIMRESSFELYEDTHTEFAPTQGDASAKTFRPLFDD